MIHSKQTIIQEIAQQIDGGNDCYYNLKSNELITIPNNLDIIDDEQFLEHIKADLEKVEKEKVNLVKIQPLKSRDSFKIMERFIDHITEPQLKLKLENALQKKQPFQRFKNLIDYSEFRQAWFDFKTNELEKIVKEKLVQA